MNVYFSFAECIAQPRDSSSGLDPGIAQNLITVQSVVVVYHLASMQAWLQTITSVQDSAEAVIFETPEGDLRRLQLARRAGRIMRSFPWPQLVLISVAMTTLTMLTIIAGQQMKDVSWIYIELPSIVLMFIYLFSSVSIFEVGRRKIKSVTARLA